MSTALISGLVLSGPAANAQVVSDDVISTSVESSTPVLVPAEPLVAPVETASKVEEAVESETAIVPAEPEVAPEVDASSQVETSEPTIDETPEPVESQPVEPTEAEESAPKVTESASATESEAETAAPADASKSAESTDSSTYVAVDGEDPRWAQIDALMPEGSEDWDEAQWEALDETEAGQELNRLINEVLADENGWGDEFELSDEELAFWESITELLPEASFDWDEAQWEAYFSSDQGLELLDLMLPFIAESIETDEDTAEFQALLEEVFAHDPELRAYYLEMFFGIEAAPEDNGTDGTATGEEMVPSQTESPSSNAVMEPAGQVKPASSDKKEEPKKSADAAAPALANTGFDGVTAAGAGLLLALAGAVVVALGRRKSAKH